MEASWAQPRRWRGAAAALAKARWRGSKGMGACCWAARRAGRNGDTVEIVGEPFEIITIFESYNLLESNGRAVIPLQELQELLGQQGRVTTFLILLDEAHKHPDKVEAVRLQIEALRSSSGGKLNIEVQATRDHIKSNLETQTLKGLAWASSMIALLIGFVSMLNTMMMSITERVREIATFRALGWRKLRLMRMIFLGVAGPVHYPGREPGSAVGDAVDGVSCQLQHDEFAGGEQGYVRDACSRVGTGLVAGVLGRDLSRLDRGPFVPGVSTAA